MMQRKSFMTGVIALSVIAVSLPALAKELKVGFSFAKPPFVFATQPFEPRFYDLNTPQLGMEIELFKAALALAGDDTFALVYVPYNRLEYELKDGTIDVAVTVRPTFPERFYSQEFIAFHNYAITKKKANLTINTLDDLKDKIIVAWQGAKFDLGKEFEQAVAENPKYLEEADQRKQARLFLMDRAQVLVVDEKIFKWWQKILTQEESLPVEEMTFHDLFPAQTVFHVGFIDEAARNAFDEGLKKIKADGTYDRIISSYID